MKKKIIAFITHSYVAVPKKIRLISIHYFINKIPNTSKLQKITIDQSSDTDFNSVMKLYKKYTSKSSSVLANNTNLAPNNP